MWDMEDLMILGCESSDSCGYRYGHGLTSLPISIPFSTTHTFLLLLVDCKNCYIRERPMTKRIEELISLRLHTLKYRQIDRARVLANSKSSPAHTHRRGYQLPKTKKSYTKFHLRALFDTNDSLVHYDFSAL